MILTWIHIAETKCSSLARGDPGGQSQKETVKSFTTGTRWDPIINGFARSAVGPTTQSFQNNDSHTQLKIPFHAENGDLNVKPHKNV